MSYGSAIIQVLPRKVFRVSGNSDDLHGNVVGATELPRSIHQFATGQSWRIRRDGFQYFRVIKQAPQTIGTKDKHVGRFERNSSRGQVGQNLRSGAQGRSQD